MSNNFSRTLRALRADGLKGWAVRAALAVLLLAIWGAWFFLGRITLWAVSDSARAEVEGFSVDAPVGGRVTSSDLARDREVSEGDLLVELDPQREVGQRETLVAELDTKIARRDELTARIAGKGSELSLFLGSSQARVNEALANVEEAESAARQAEKEEEQQRRLFEQELAPRGELDKAISTADQERARAESARAAAELARTERDVEAAERRTEIQQLQGDLEVLSSEIRTAETRIANLETELGLRQIRAPASGVLARVAQLRAGSMVEEGEEIAFIVPSGQIGAVAMYEPADAVGRIHPGQQARLRLDAFPSTQFGTIPATVAAVDSETTDGRIRVNLELDDEQPTNIQLQHGMPGRVEVEVDRLSPASLLMRAVGRMLDQPAGSAD